MKHFTKEFKEISKNDAASAGGKGASLGEMTQAGISVPPGFVILADAFENFLHQAEIHTEIDAILHKVNHQAMHTVEQASEEIKAIILSAQMPKEIVQEILTAFKKLDSRFVAVRSSATAEDSSTAAWAGQLESYLNTTKDQLLENVKRCWASLFTPRAIFYRFEQNLHQQHISVAVVVQKMVESEVSGIAFSVHPVTQDYNQLIIEAGLGLGEAIVSGQITPDSYVVEKKGWEITEKNVAAQTKALYRSKNGGNQWKEISGSRQKLSEAQILELSRLIVRIEQHYDFPVDVEWALEKKKFYIVQSRPITTLVPILKQNITQKIKLKLVVTRKYGLLTSELFIEGLSNPENYKKLLLLKKFFVGSGVIFDRWYFGPEINVLGKTLLEKESKNAGFADKVFSTIYNFGEKMLMESERIKKTDFSRKDSTELVDTFRKFVDIYRTFTVALAGWGLQAPVEVRLRKILRDRSSIDEDLALLTFPIKQNIINQEQEELLKIVIEIQKEKLLPKELGDLPKNILHKIQKHIGEFGWMTRGGIDEFWTSEDVFNRIQDLLKENCAQKLSALEEWREGGKKKSDLLLKELKADKQLCRLVSIAKELVYFRTYRTDYLNLSIFNIRPLLKEIGKRLGYDLTQVSYLRLNEILNFKPIDKREIEQRMKNFCIRCIEPNKVVFSSDPNEIKQEEESYFIKEVVNLNKIKGNTAFKGIVTGKVVLISNKKDLPKVKEGDIIVTAMTIPDYVSVMQKAAAFVTDEGGITCHAAIIAREMKKPCIIGTKIATKVLKDGDLVEVDADKGIVKIINRADNSRDFDELNPTRFKEYILHHQMDIQKAVASFFGADLVYSAYTGAERFLGFNPGPILTYFKGRDFIQLIPQETLIKITESFSKKYFCNQKQMDSFFDEHQKIRLEIDRLWKKYESENKKDPQSFLNFYDSLIAKSTPWWEYAFYGENKGEIITQKVVATIAKNKSLGESQAREAVSIFLHSDEISVFTQERLEFYHLCLEVGQNKKISSLLEKREYNEVLKDKAFDQKVLKYVQNYFFKDTDFYDRKVLTKITVLKEIKDTYSRKGLKGIKKDLSEMIDSIKEITQKKKVIALELKLTPDEKNLLSLACKFVRWMDERKYGMMTQLYYFYSFFHHLSEQRGIPYEQIVDLGVKDIRKIILGSKPTILPSQTPKLHLYENGQHIFAFLGQEADHQLEIIRGLPPSLNEFSGIVACREKNNQKIKGKVKIIKDPVLEPFQQGEILVTSMTRIEFVPLMKKALAIITDEGGIACHAAIVSRELGIPCLIGTKIATQVLKDGDLVEVDANKGIVRKLSNTQTSNTANSLTVSIEIAKIDWTKYLEREQPLFLFASFIRPYGELLQQATGIGFVHQLHTFQDKSGVFYKSKQEMAEVDAYFLGLIRRNDPRLAGWAKNAKAAGSLANRLIVKFTKNPRIDGSTFWNDYQNYEKVLLYDTVIPYRVLSAINSALEAGEDFKIFKQALALFEPFRKSSRYPELVQKVCTQFWHAAARAIDEKDSALLSLATPEELRAIFEDGIKLDRNELRQRKQWCAFWIDPKTKIIQFSYDQTLTSKIPALGKITVDLREFKGNVAYPGLVRGTVRIINDLAQSNKVRDGDIIVSINTNPSLMPVILKCAGIVTDEGGIMCHAAIVARELKKPCIIGTKIATQVLKDGDLVEVNATEGIVKIIKRK